jgi:undecaprenyl-diphosphatase
MPLWQVVTLGIVQGLTEFLPVSSTAHLIVAQRLMGRSEAHLKDDPFTVAIQLGTLVAVFAYFRGDLIRMARAVATDLIRGNWFASRSNDSRIATWIVLGTVPVVVCGVLFKKTLEKSFYTPLSIGVVAIVFGLLMLLSEWWASRQVRRGLTPRDETQITWLDALAVGLFQCLALMPGGSRSGTTITAGLFAGLERAAAARFSFLLSIPAVLGAGLKDCYDKRNELMNSETLYSLGIGLAVSAVVGYLCIAGLISFLKRFSTAGFVAYRVIFGAVLIALALSGWFGDGK